MIENVSRALLPISASVAVMFRNLEPVGRLSDTVTTKADWLNCGALSLMSIIVMLTLTVSVRGGVPLSVAWTRSECLHGLASCWC